MATFTAVYDACVLYRAPLRAMLMQLAMADLFRARWTDAIHDEWTRNLLKTRPELAAELSRTRRLMDENVRDGLVVGYEGLIPGLVLPDRDDRHVLAAAIRCGAASIVTFNLRDFPASALAPYGIEAVHPDTFVADQVDLDEAAVCGAVKIVRARLKRPPMGVEEYLASLERQGLSETVSRLREYAALF